MTGKKNNHATHVTESCSDQCGKQISCFCVKNKWAVKLHCDGEKMMEHEDVARQSYSDTDPLFTTPTEEFPSVRWTKVFLPVIFLHTECICSFKRSLSWSWLDIANQRGGNWEASRKALEIRSYRWNPEHVFVIAIYCLCHGKKKCASFCLAAAWA